MRSVVVLVNNNISFSLNCVPNFLMLGNYDVSINSDINSIMVNVFI
jgi:hypothetical protein